MIKHHSNREQSLGATDKSRRGGGGQKSPTLAIHRFKCQYRYYYTEKVLEDVGISDLSWLKVEKIAKKLLCPAFAFEMLGTKCYEINFRGMVFMQ